MAPCPWPSREERQRCALAWKASTPSQRQSFLRIDDRNAVRGFKIADSFLAVKAMRACALLLGQPEPEDADLVARAVTGRGGGGWPDDGKEDDDDVALLASTRAVTEEARRLAGLSVVEYDQLLTKAEFSRAFCARADSLELLLERAAKTREELEAVTERAASGLVVLDGCEVQGIETWENLAREVYTLALVTLVGSISDDPLSVETLRRALTMPRAAKLRSWPSKKQLELLRSRWAAATTEQRVELTTLSGAQMWFLQACDSVISLRVLGQTLRAGMSAAEVGEALQRLRAGVRLDQFVGRIEPTERMFFAPAFVEDRHCLEHLLKYAVPQLSAKEELVSTASQATLRTVFASHALARAKAEEDLTWEALATVVSTLVLEAAIQRCHVEQASEQLLVSRQATRAERERERRADKAARRRAERKVTAEAAEDASVGSTGSAPAALAVSPLSELPYSRPAFRVRRTFVELDDDDDDEPEGGGGGAARVRASSAEW
jgi:hypothetical protein